MHAHPPRSLLALDRFAAAIAAAFALHPSAGLSQQIITDGRTATSLSISGSVTDITTGTVHGVNAFNSFSRFDVYTGNTVNLHVPDAAANLINLVSGEVSRIDGMLNAVKGGSIGGNVFFLNPHGIIVGRDGVINAGSLTLITPASSFMDAILDARGVPDVASTARLLEGHVPINNAGLIFVQGTINAQGGVKLSGGNVQIPGVVQSGAVFQHAQAAFSDVVNVAGMQNASEIRVVNGVVEIVASENVAISGKVASEGANNLAGGTVKVRATGGINLGDAAVLSVRGRGKDSNGGVLDLFADGNARLADQAKLDARGGEVSGNGGFAELSARDTVTIAGGFVDTSATSGSHGTFLVDPLNIVISTNSTTSFFTGGNGVFEATDSIEIAPGVIVSSRTIANMDEFSAAGHPSAPSTGNSGNLIFRAPQIRVREGAQVLAQGGNGFLGGDISFLAMPTNGGHAEVLVDRATVRGRNIMATAAVSNGTTSQSARVTVDGSLLEARDGSITLTATSTLGVAAATSVAETIVRGNARLISARDDAALATGGEVVSDTRTVLIKGTHLVVVQDGAQVDAGDGKIVVESDGDAGLGGLRTTNASSDAVRVDVGGRVLSSAGNAPAVTARSTGAVVNLRGGQGIGNGTHDTEGATDVVAPLWIDVSAAVLDGGAGSVHVTNTGKLDITTARADRDIEATAAGDIRAGVLYAGGKVSVSTESAIDVHTVSGKQGIDLSAHGDVIVRDLVESVDYDITVRSTTGNVEVQRAQITFFELLPRPAGAIVIEALGGNVTVQDASTYMGNILVTAGGQGKVTAGRLDTIFGALVVRTNDGDIVVDHAHDHTGRLRLSAGGAGNLIAGTVSSTGGDLTLESENGDIRVDVLRSWFGSLAVTAGGTGRITARDIQTVHGTITVRTNDGEISLETIATAGTRLSHLPATGVVIAAGGTGAIAVTSVRSEERTIELRSEGGNVSVGEARSGLGEILITAGGAGNLAVGTVESTGGDLRLQSANGDITVNLARSEFGDMAFIAGGAGRITAYEIQATQGTIAASAVGDIRAGALDVGGKVSLSTDSAIDVHTVTGKQGVDLVAYGDVIVRDLVESEDYGITVRSTTGNIEVQRAQITFFEFKPHPAGALVFEALDGNVTVQEACTYMGNMLVAAGGRGKVTAGRLDTTFGALVVRTNDGDIVVDHAHDHSGRLLLSAGGAGNLVARTVDSTAGQLKLESANGDISVDVLRSWFGSLFVTAGGAGNARVQSAEIVAGTIELHAEGGNLTVGTATSESGNVTLGALTIHDPVERLAARTVTVRAAKGDIEIRALRFETANLTAAEEGAVLRVLSANAVASRIVARADGIRLDEVTSESTNPLVFDLGGNDGGLADSIDVNALPDQTMYGLSGPELIQFDRLYSQDANIAGGIPDISFVETLIGRQGTFASYSRTTDTQFKVKFDNITSTLSPGYDAFVSSSTPFHMHFRDRNVFETNARVSYPNPEFGAQGLYGSAVDGTVLEQVLKRRVDPTAPVGRVTIEIPGNVLGRNSTAIDGEDDLQITLPRRPSLGLRR